MAEEVEWYDEEGWKYKWATAAATEVLQWPFGILGNNHPLECQVCPSGPLATHILLTQDTH